MQSDIKLLNVYALFEKFKFEKQSDLWLLSL